MKLLNCTECHDVVKLQREERRCLCGRSRARHVEDERVEASGPYRVLGIANREYELSLRLPTPEWPTKLFLWFVVSGDRP